MIMTSSRLLFKLKNISTVLVEFFVSTPSIGKLCIPKKITTPAMMYGRNTGNVVVDLLFVFYEKINTIVKVML